jgi:chromosome segregation ATPase
MLLMPKGSVDEQKKAQLDASLMDEQRKLVELRSLQGKINDLKNDLSRKKELVRQEFNQFLLDIEDKKDAVRQDLKVLINERDILDKKVYELRRIIRGMGDGQES